MEANLNAENEPKLSLLEEIHVAFGEKNVDLRTFSPLTLAYIGDAIYEVVIRTLVVEDGQKAPNTLHKHTTKLVKAQTQSALAQILLEDMTDKEQDVYRRGKNTKVHSAAKNATLTDYRRATGFETVCGYLYLNGETGRMIELIKLGLEKLGLEV